MLSNTDVSHLFNLTAEYEILGALMCSNDLLEHIPFLSADHFHSEPHRQIFLAITDTLRAGKLANALTLKAQFTDNPLLQEAGGAAYLAAAMGKGGLTPFPVETAKYLVELAQRRALLGACEEAATVLQNTASDSPAEIALGLARRFEEVSRGFNGPRLIDDYHVTEQILADLKDGRPPCSTGVAKLDACMDGGLYPGKAYGFAAKKKVGKTILASTISCNLNQQAVKHLFVCGEMSPQEIHQRNLARLTDSFPSAFRNEYGRSPDFQRKIADVAVRSPRCILYYNAPSLTFDDLRRVIVTAALQQGIKGFILDYWQLVGGKAGKKSTSEHLDEVAQWIADTCRKYGIWSIVMAQINQEGNTRGGEGIRLAFDQVYHLQAPEEDNGRPYRWLQMMDTRYTAWQNIGSETQPGLFMNEHGPYFEQV